MSKARSTSGNLVCNDFLKPEKQYQNKKIHVHCSVFEIMIIFDYVSFYLFERQTLMQNI
jgi:hypothetical protein